MESPATLRAPFVHRLLTLSRNKIDRSPTFRVFISRLISDLIFGAVGRLHVALVAANRWYVEQPGCAALGIRCLVICSIVSVFHPLLLHPPTFFPPFLPPHILTSGVFVHLRQKGHTRQHSHPHMWLIILLMSEHRLDPASKRSSAKSSQHCLLTVIGRNDDDHNQ